MKTSRPKRDSHAPGEFFFYNNWDFNTLGPILERATGKRVADEFRSRIVGPLGMEDFRPQDASEQLEPSNSIHPAYAFRISVRDLARFGQLYLQKGEWSGQQVVPEAWIKESTSVQTTFEDGSGYGYMWWVHPAGTLGAQSGLTLLDRVNKFSGRGTGGQFLLVIPGAELVFAHTVDTENGRSVRGPKVWKLAEMVLAAKVSEPAESQQSAALNPARFSNAPPPLQEHHAVELDSKKLAAFVGEYAAEPQMHVRVFEFHNRLFATVRGVGEAELFPESDTEFFTKTGNAQISFIKDSAGRVTEARSQFNGQTNTLPKSP